MAAKKSTNTALQQKVKVLAKLYDSGCKTEKDFRRQAFTCWHLCSFM